jgi:DNA-binding MarR family transcriptional regulator
MLPTVMAEPEPPVFMKAWVAFLRAHSRVVAAVSRELEAACGIPLTWFDVLFQLSVAPGGQRRMLDLADAVLLSKSGLTRLLDRMEEAGLIARTAVPGNRRSLHAQLTPSGQQLQRRARQVVRRAVERQFAAHLTEAELETLRDALVRLATGTPAGRQ